MRDRQVLLLNASEEVLRVVDWQKAVILLMTGKAISPYMKIKEYQIQSTSGTYRLPKVLMLSQYVSIPHKENLPTRRNILARDKWTCQYCNRGSKDRTKMTIDHVMPKSRGGDSSWTNLVAACERCNSVKGNKTPKECNMHLKKKPFRPTSIQMHLSRLSGNVLDEWTHWLNKKND